MKKEVITIKDIAREAQCASSTVSKLLNGGNVREPHKSRILKIMQEYDYKPNSLAKGLRNRHSYAVGVCFPEFNNMFAMNIMTMLEKELNKRGYSALVCSSDNNVETEKKKLQFLLEKQVEGIILIPCSNDGRHIAQIVGDQVPVVLIDRLCSRLDTDAVLLNNRQISEQVTQNLLSRHEKVAIICSGDTYTGIQRYEGYVAAHEKMHRCVEQAYVKDGGYTVDGGYLRMMELWNAPVRPEALFVTNYEMTIGVVMAINELGLRTPEDLRLVGFDYVGLARAISHELSIVEQPMQEMVEMAASLLFRRMREDTAAPQKLECCAKIVDLERNIL